MASLDDILTTQKNGVIAINNLSQNIGIISAIYRGSPLPVGSISSTVSTLYTVLTGQQFTLTDIEICNTSASPTSFSIFLVASGGTAGTTNALFYNAPISGHSTVQWSGSTALSAGYSIQASSAASTVTMKISGGAS